MEMIYFTAAAVLLYLVSDWILNRIESRRGERFVNRSLIFFAIILLLALALFGLIRQLQPPAPPMTTAPGAEQQEMQTQP